MEPLTTGGAIALVLLLRLITMGRGDGLARQTYHASVGLSIPDPTKRVLFSEVKRLTEYPILCYIIRLMPKQRVSGALL